MTTFSKLLLTSIGVLALGVTRAGAVSIPLNSGTGLFNTGVDSSGTVLPDQTLDTHYTVVAGPDGANPLYSMTAAAFPLPTPGDPTGPWLPNDAVSAWVSENLSSYGYGGEGMGAFHNVTSFTSPNAGTVTIKGQWSTDDSGSDIVVNETTPGNASTGTSTGNTAGGFSAWYPFTIVEPVVAGKNYLDFIQVDGGSPGGVRVEFTSASVTPEPASLSLLGLGGLSLLARRRRA